MKKNTPSKFIDLQNNSISNLKSFASNIKRIVFMFVFSLFCTPIFAQSENSVTPKVMEVKSYISTLKTAEQNSNLSFSNAKNVEELVYTVQPSIYYYSGDLKSYGEKPKKLYTDIISLKSLSSADLLKNNIEIIILKIDKTSDFNSTIDLDLFSDFIKLKYICIESSQIVSELNIAKIFLNYDEQYGIFYKIDKGE